MARAAVPRPGGRTSYLLGYNIDREKSREGLGKWEQMNFKNTDGARVFSVRASLPHVHRLGPQSSHCGLFYWGAA